MNEIRNCKVHGDCKHNLQGKKRPRWYCSKCSVDSCNLRRKRLKEKAIEYKGGCCSICGYNKCNRALNFHHLDPSVKEFGISRSSHYTKWEKVKEELDKCVLVCANCHMEIHDTECIPSA